MHIPRDLFESYYYSRRRYIRLGMIIVIAVQALALTTKAPKRTEIRENMLSLKKLLKILLGSDQIETSKL